MMPSRTSRGTSHHALLALLTVHVESSRFVLNIPEYERNSIERVGFQVEIWCVLCETSFKSLPHFSAHSHWYYEDFVREQNLDFPSCTLKKFYSLLWKAVPLLKDWHALHEKAFEHFMEYKQFVPVCGAILLNRDLDKVRLSQFKRRVMLTSLHRPSW